MTSVMQENLGDINNLTQNKGQTNQDYIQDFTQYCPPPISIIVMMIPIKMHVFAI